MAFICINNQFIESAQPVIRSDDRGFRFGDGVFETIAVVRGVPCQWELHLARLQEGLRALRIEAELSGLAASCGELLKKNQLRDGVLRIAISRGVGSQGYLPKPDGKGATIVIETLPPVPLPVDAVKLWLSGVEKISPQALPVSCKLAQGVNSTLAKMEAVDHDCFDALQCNGFNEICEAASANIFWLRDGTLYTPALTCGVVAGTTRELVLRLSPWPVKEGHYKLEALQNAEAVFLTNSNLLAWSVSELQPQGWEWKSEAATKSVRELLLKDREAYVAAHA